jgi:hypothetical protein
MSTTRWTTFWKRYDIKTIKRSRTLKNYSVKKDISALSKIGVDKITADRIYKKSSSFKDPLFFNMFSRFFRKDAQMITQWLKAKSVTDGFEKLYAKISSGNMDKVTETFNDLHILFRYYNKGKTRQYEGVHPKKGKVNFDPKLLVLNLNRSDNKARYKKFGSTVLGNDHFICIGKEGQVGQMVFKFLKLTIEGGKIKIDLSMHSNREYGIAKKAIEKWLGVRVDTPQSTKRLKKLENFLINGESPNFLMTGVTYYDNNFKLNVTDIYNRPRNVGALLAYKRKLQIADKKIEIVSQVRLYHKGKLLSRPVPVDILSYKSAGVIGAILLVPNERKLNSVRKTRLANEFKKDFGLDFYSFVTYKDLDDKGIYKIFLEETTQRVENFDLRSKLSMKIYQELLSDKLLSMSGKMEEQTRFCVNSDCVFAFKPVWDRTTCSHCGEMLINGSKFITQNISEESVVDFIVSNYKNATVTKLSNQVLKRPIYLARIEDGEDIVELLPLNGAFKPHQLEILKFRYPNLVVITSLDNMQDLEDKQLKALKLFELIYDCKKNKAKGVDDLVMQSAAEYLVHSRGLFLAAHNRIADNSFYKAQNKLSKYFGAEMYEADCSALLNYIFGNCVWLGAKYRGKKVPDGFAAFPLHDKKQGCFIWDGKFGEGYTLHMGNFSKNRAYIEAAKKNQSIKDNGGLKAFIFISNKRFPKSFTKKYLPLTNGSRIKINFLSSAQLKRIAEHFCRHEKLLFNNENAKGIFLDSMKSVLFSIKNGIKTEIIDNNALSLVLSTNNSAFAAIKAGKVLKP